MAISNLSASKTLSFGPFTIIAGERLLLRDGRPVEVSARAFDILLALTERPHEIVGKRELLAQVWPDVAVEEGSLRFHIAALRKALGDGRDGARYIATMPGRGYCLVAPISTVEAGPKPTADNAATLPQANLPHRPGPTIGRADAAQAVATWLNETRLVSIVGSGGVGKTTLAIEVGHNLVDAYGGTVNFVDLGTVTDPALVATTVCSMLGLSITPDDAIAGLVAHLGGRYSLLILDTCEHVIDAAATLASRLISDLPDAHILVTSREPLNVESEHVFKLSPLACPPPDAASWADIEAYSAAKLFLHRAKASGAHLEHDATSGALIGEICRKLDGVPLAIELAAARVPGYGLERVAALLDERLTLAWPGRRSAPPRQKTLQATLDWSYGLLSDVERLLLRRLAVFVGHVSIEAVLSVATDQALAEASLFTALDSLVAKSMVVPRPVGAAMRYRLLDTTRAYTRQLAADDPEWRHTALRHAAYYLGWLEATGEAWPALASTSERSVHLSGIANARAALSWSYGPSGDVDLGGRLAAAAAPVLLSMSLLTECHDWSARALANLGEASRGKQAERELQTALGVSLMFTRGGKVAARAALTRSLAISDKAGDLLAQIRVLGPLQMFHLRTGEFKAALACAERCSVLALSLSDPVASAMAHAVLGISFHFAGAFDRARLELEAALRSGSDTERTTTLYLGLDGKILAGAILARVLWLQGYPDQAVERARATIKDATSIDHALTLCIALSWAISVFEWVGDLDAVEAHVDWFIARAQPNSFAPYLEVGQGWQGALAIRRGHAEAGVPVLRRSLEKLHAMPYELLSTPLTLALIQGLSQLGSAADALALTDETIQAVKKNGDTCYLPELLRVKATMALGTGVSDVGSAEALLRQSLALSKAQGARSWELRAAIDLAALMADRGQPGEARAILEPVFGSFGKDAGSTDLNSARRLLDEMAADRSFS